MMPSFADLTALYSENKDVACALAGFAYPVGRFLIWSGGKGVSAGCWLTRWAFSAGTTAPPTCDPARRWSGGTAP